jgi:hypothetical protein
MSKQIEVHASLDVTNPDGRPIQRFERGWTVSVPGDGPERLELTVPAALNGASDPEAISAAVHAAEHATRETVRQVIEAWSRA